VCCAAGLASLNVLIEEDLIKPSNDKSELFKKLLKHPIIQEVRGEGLMLAVQLIGYEYVQYVISKAPEYGLILDYFLFCDSAFRIAPPLTINNEEINWACSQLMILLEDAKRNIVRK
jgi:acetylornithine/succinyldiaminopimelate/putrescine aminotransferase